MFDLSVWFSVAFCEGVVGGGWLWIEGWFCAWWIEIPVREERVYSIARHEKENIDQSTFITWSDKSLSSYSKTRIFSQEIWVDPYTLLVLYQC